MNTIRYEYENAGADFVPICTPLVVDGGWHWGLKGKELLYEKKERTGNQ